MVSARERFLGVFLVKPRNRKGNKPIILTFDSGLFRTRFRQLVDPPVLMRFETFG